MLALAPIFILLLSISYDIDMPHEILAIIFSIVALSRISSKSITHSNIPICILFLNTIYNIL